MRPVLIELSTFAGETFLETISGAADEALGPVRFLRVGKRKMSERWLKETWLEFTKRTQWFY
jgi:hypothetical protein